MTWDRVERLIGSDNLKRLAQKKVGVIGLGSGGGFVALSLAMSGIGKFVLIDDDVLEKSNIARHVADRRDLGRPKAKAVADLIRQRNPQAEIEIYQGRVEDHLDLLADFDLLAVGVDGEGSKYVINEACLQHNLIAVYAGVYERGEGGDVVVIYPGDGPCYACWAAELREGLQLSETEGGLDYGMIGPEGTLEAEPGLWLHVVRIAATQTDFILKELLRGSDQYEELPGNTVILANDAIEIIDGEITPPHSAVWVNVARDPECLVCGDRLRLEDSSADSISLDSLAAAIDIQMEEDEESSQHAQD